MKTKDIKMDRVTVIDESRDGSQGIQISDIFI